jgi:ankyrin repeat protein
MVAGSLDAIKLLVEHGVDINAFNTNGQTVLHSAAARGSTAIIRYVAEQGGRLDKKDKQGRTALDIAQGAGGGGRGTAGAAGARGGGPRGNAEAAALLRDLMAKK